MHQVYIYLWMLGKNMKLTFVYSGKYSSVKMILLLMQNYSQNKYKIEHALQYC